LSVRTKASYSSDRGGGCVLFTQNFSLVADIAGILGFILTIVLLVRSEALRKKIAATLHQKTNYATDRKAMIRQLKAIRDGLLDKDALLEEFVVKIDGELHSIEAKFGNLSIRKDKKHIDAIRKLIEAPIEQLDRHKLRMSLNPLISRFERNEL